MNLGQLGERLGSLLDPLPTETPTVLGESTGSLGSQSNGTRDSPDDSENCGTQLPSKDIPGDNTEGRPQRRHSTQLVRRGCPPTASQEGL